MMTSLAPWMGTSAIPPAAPNNHDLEDIGVQVRLADSRTKPNTNIPFPMKRLVPPHTVVAEWLRKCVESNLKWCLSLIQRHPEFDGPGSYLLTFGSNFQTLILLGEEEEMPESLDTTRRIGVGLALHSDDAEDEAALERNGLFDVNDIFWEQAEYDEEEVGGCLYHVVTSEHRVFPTTRSTNVRMIRVNSKTGKASYAGLFAEATSDLTVTITGASELMAAAKKKSKKTAPNDDEQEEPKQQGKQKSKRKRGRPAGSRRRKSKQEGPPAKKKENSNDTPAEAEEEEEDSSTEAPPPQKKTPAEAEEEDSPTEAPPPPKRKRGRPSGSKNKPKPAVADASDEQNSEAEEEPTQEKVERKFDTPDQEGDLAVEDEPVSDDDDDKEEAPEEEEPKKARARKGSIESSGSSESTPRKSSRKRQHPDYYSEHGIQEGGGIPAIIETRSSEDDEEEAGKARAESKSNDEEDDGEEEVRTTPKKEKERYKRAKKSDGDQESSKKNRAVAVVRGNKKAAKMFQAFGTKKRRSMGNSKIADWFPREVELLQAAFLGRNLKSQKYLSCETWADNEADAARKTMEYLASQGDPPPGYFDGIENN